ncbi:dehydrogenase [Nocardia colli]|uniref:Dehydrogenase n=1 Tax=Nocardia colli TaxID=2545717 RepID=A0A5N0EJA3_9NOCA|nr:GMC oxidoreductase [Nocardia colli]KAA8889467.1 dehydrogenase [Nocardia colli]
MSVQQNFDVIVVGGGSAGAVLATRLSERRDQSVLLLEAGPAYPPQDYPLQVALAANVGAFTGHDWGYRSEPGFVTHPIEAWRGKLLGGCSAVNGSVVARARPADFERWTAAEVKGWSFDEVLPAFRALESTTAGDDAWHGRTGPFPVRQLALDEVSDMQRAFVESALAVGLPAVEDFNGPDAHGVGPYAMNVIDGVRVNTGMAYLTEAVRARSNLTIRDRTLVDRVLFDGARAVGVRLADGTVLAAGEVILSAGAYGSPAILLRSGIGPGHALYRLNIPVIADLPVGETLYDHPFYYNAYAAVPTRIGVPYPVIGAKVWTASPGAAPGELDIHITATHLVDQQSSPTGSAFVLAVALTRPESCGSLTLTSRDPAVAPRIDLNFLAEPADRHRLRYGIDLARRIAAEAPLADLIDHEIAPGPHATDAEIEASMAATLDTYHHPTSTVPMGAPGDPLAVVDHLGNVRDLDGLRVVDASIFPDIPSAATNATVIMAAEHIAAQL